MTTTDDARANSHTEAVVAEADLWLSTNRVSETWRTMNRLRDALVRAAGRAETTTAGIAWDPGAEADYRAGRWCGQCRYGVVEDPPCCTQPAETTTATIATARTRPTETEWAVRGQHTGSITPQHGEKHAQAIANALPYYSVVRREVTAWAEADR